MVCLLDIRHRRKLDGRDGKLAWWGCGTFFGIPLVKMTAEKMASGGGDCFVAKNAPRNDTQHGGQAGTKYHEEGRQEAEGAMNGYRDALPYNTCPSSMRCKAGFVVQ